MKSKLICILLFVQFAAFAQEMRFFVIDGWTFEKPKGLIYSKINEPQFSHLFSDDFGEVVVRFGSFKLEEAQDAGEVLNNLIYDVMVAENLKLIPVTVGDANLTPERLKDLNLDSGISLIFTSSSQHIIYSCYVRGTSGCIFRVECPLSFTQDQLSKFKLQAINGLKSSK